MKRFHVIVDGKVQGVGFRYHTQITASQRDLTGWVRNKLDGTVELEVQGDPDQIVTFLSSLEKARFPAKVADIKSTEISIQENEGMFSVRG
ncbi:acylphosphatase [Salipaludibacillus daqingensis]|uniref:acylphosphatase n=1 Tax=Salipaludibacillus daqingensis TaxID=3041001 RepID=UPI002475F7D5|nr:acylphosphatase [Salipaludibacillus daqingensis]